MAEERQDRIMIGSLDSDDLYLFDSLDVPAMALLFL
jgi:hypothetical protein